MLPSSNLNNDPKQAYRFADTAIVLLVKKMEMAGARSARMKAKIAGGAQMFAAITNSSISNIGQRNIAAVKETLAKLRIPIIADDTGKNYGLSLIHILTFVPKIVAIALMMLLLGPWMITMLSDFMRNLFSMIPTL